MEVMTSVHQGIDLFQFSESDRKAIKLPRRIETANEHLYFQGEQPRCLRTAVSLGRWKALLYERNPFSMRSRHLRSTNPTY